MICAFCKAEGNTSKVYEGSTVVTAMGSQTFWDEHGQRHDHDPNVCSQSFRCSKEHEWGTSDRSRCPAVGCQWNARLFDLAPPPPEPDA